MTKTAPNSCATAFIIRAINNRPHHHVARSAARAREDRKDDVQDVCVFVEYAHGRARHTWRRNPLGGARGASVGYGMCACRGQARVAADALPLPHVVRVAMPCGHLRCARRGAAASDLCERPAAVALRAGNQRSAGVKATPSQWNAMRAALGPKVSDKNVAELLRKHGDDTKGAIADFYGVKGMY